MNSQDISFSILEPTQPLQYQTKSSNVICAEAKRFSTHQKPSQFNLISNNQSTQQYIPNKHILQNEEISSPRNSIQRMLHSHQDEELASLQKQSQINNELLANQQIAQSHLQVDDQSNTPQLSVSNYGSIARNSIKNKKQTRVDYINNNNNNSPMYNSPFQRLQTLKQIQSRSSNFQNIQNSQMDKTQKSQIGKQENNETIMPNNSDKFENLLKYIQLKPIIQRVVNRLETRRKRALKPNHLFYINDQSTINLQDQEQGEKKYYALIFLEFIMSLFSNFLSYLRIPITNPANYYKVAWDILNLLCIFLLIYLIPIVLSFQIHIKSLVNQWLLLLLQLITGLDIFFSFNTAYYQKGIVVKDRLKIIINYLGSQFIIDIISFLALIIISISIEYEFYHAFLLVYLIKLSNVSSMSKKLEETFNFSSYVSNLFQLLRLLLTIIIISHLFACLWSVDQETATWLDNIKTSNEEWYERYLIAVYFCTVTMVTVGYGDVRPVSQIEYLLSIFTILIACGVFGYAVNMLGKIFESLRDQQNYIITNMRIINQYMQKKSISNILKYQIREYLEYIWKQSLAGQMTEENRIIKQLSESLQQDLLYEANKIVLDDFVLFKKNFSQQCIAKMVPLIIENRFSPEEFICVKDQEDDCSIYFIESGKVEICLYNTSSQKKQIQKITKLKKGQSFGFQSFLTGSRRNMAVRSVDFTSLLQIKRKDFLEMIVGFEEDYERFCVLKDSVMNEKNQSILELPCLCCGMKDHIVDQCIYIHHIPNAGRIKGLLNRQMEQKRDTFKRKQKNGNALGQYCNYQECIIKLFDNNYDDIVNYIQENKISHGVDMDDIMISEFSEQQLDKFGYNFEQIAENASSDEDSNDNSQSIISEELSNIENFNIQLQKIQTQYTKTFTTCEIPDENIPDSIHGPPKESHQLKILDFKMHHPNQYIISPTSIGNKKINFQYTDIQKQKNNKKKQSYFSNIDDSPSPLSPLKFHKIRSNKFITYTHRNQSADSGSIGSPFEIKKEQNKGINLITRLQDRLPFRQGSKIDQFAYYQGQRTPKINSPLPFPDNIAQSQALSRSSMKKIQFKNTEETQNCFSDNTNNKYFTELRVYNLFNYDFESQKNYKKYFYKFNMNAVVERYKIKLEKMKKKKMMMNHLLQKNMKQMQKANSQMLQQLQQQQLSQFLNMGQSQLFVRRKESTTSSFELVYQQQNHSQLNQQIQK